MQPIGERAVVLGASMGGLLAARVLADAYERVTVVERDQLPPPGGQRRGVPQGRHAHGLLMRGHQALEELFPGLTGELVARGAMHGDMQVTVRWYNDGLCLRQAPSDLPGLLVSRPLLEGHVRRRLLDLPNVEVVERCDVAGLAATDDRRRVTGARVIRRADGSAEEVLAADLVVDATGRGSRGPAWLEALGYQPPDEEQVRIGVTYMTRLYRRRPDHLDGDLGALVAVTEDRRGAFMLALEDDRWIVTLIGYLGERPPADPDGFVAYAARLPVPAVHQVIADAEPLAEPVPARFPSSLRRRYERLDRFPEGYLAVGDAICSFNPVFGQGMTVAALEALALRRCLGEGTGHLARRFFRRAATLLDVPWDIAVGADLRFPEVQGRRGAKVRLVNAYLARLHPAAHHDPVVGRAFLRVVNLLDRPERLLAPAVALRVLAGGRRRPGPAGRMPPLLPGDHRPLTHTSA